MNFLRVQKFIKQYGEYIIYNNIVIRNSDSSSSNNDNSSNDSSSSSNNNIENLRFSPMQNIQSIRIFYEQGQFYDIKFKPIDLISRQKYTRLYFRYKTFIDYGIFFKENSEISEFLAKNGFYVEESGTHMNCCMECISYNIVDVINRIKIIIEEEEDEEKAEDWERKVNILKEKIPLQHSNCCQYKRPVARSKIFFSEEQNLFFESERLNSFIEFPHFHHNNFCLSPNVLAKKGFYYLRVQDYIKCVFCHRLFKELNKIIIDNNADTIVNHLCDSRRLKFNISLEMSNILEDLKLNKSDYFPACYPTENYSIKTNKDPHLTQLGVCQVKLPIYPEYKLKATREKSFKHFSFPHIRLMNLSWQQLAEAGFFYIGKVFFFFFFVLYENYSHCYILSLSVIKYFLYRYFRPCSLLSLWYWH